MGRYLRHLGLFALLCVACLWLGNNSLIVRGTDQHQTRVIAHRGVHQIYVGTDRNADACHATPLAPIEHAYIENTLPSMAEAFRIGGDVVELDVHLTPEGRFAVFHDWTLDCRTDGTGVTHKQSIAYLKTLDLGYRLKDSSGSYPLRGTAVGLMPTLSEVLAADLPGTYLINFKSRRAEDGDALAALIAQQQAGAAVYGVYGGGPPTQAALVARPGLRGFDKASVRTCLLRYMALGWSGHVPEACRDTMVMVPQSHARLLWGWPHRFTRRMRGAGTDVILVGPYDGSGFSSGIDDAEAASHIPARFDGYIWTNRVEVIAPLLAARN